MFKKLAENTTRCSIKAIYCGLTFYKQIRLRKTPSFSIKQSTFKMISLTIETIYKIYVIRAFVHS